MTDPNPPPSNQLLLFAAVASPTVKEGRPATQSHGPPDDPRHDRTEGDGGETAYLELPWDFSSSFPEPLEEAFVFGTLHPDDAEPENIAAIHVEHAAEAYAMLRDLEALEEARRLGVSPSTGKPPATEKQREELDQLFTEEPDRLRRRFDDHLAAYADGFGLEAADAFAITLQLRHRGIDVVQRITAKPYSVSLPVLNNPRPHAEDQWDEGHPWHYLHEGDRATPMPADRIEPTTRPFDLHVKLPKDDARKRQLLTRMHHDAVRQLGLDKQRYEDLRKRGIDAVGEYDRTIAYGGDLQLAWASSVALKYNHIRHGLARVAGLQKLLDADEQLFGATPANTQPVGDEHPDLQVG